MKATKKLVTLLAIIAIALIAVTVGLYSYKPEIKTDFVEGSLLIQGINPETVHKLVVNKGGETLTLTREGSGFVVAEKNNYPAETKKVNELFFKVLDIRCQSMVTDDAENHKELGVLTDSPKEGSIAMFDKDGKPVVTVLVGTNPEHGDGPHVRLDGQEKVYIAEKSLWFNATATSYMLTKVLDVSKDKVQQVTVKTAKSNYAILNKNNKGELQGIPEGKKAKQSDVDTAFNALSYLTLTDVYPAKDAAATWDATVTCTLKKHLTYTLSVGKKGTKHVLKVSAAGPAQAVLQKHVNEVNQRARAGQKLSDEEMKKKDEILSASKDAEDFNKKHGPWVYEISEWKANNLRKEFADLIEDDNPDDPSEIAASHILIAYKGASKADAKITRTKDEAKTLAEELLAKAKAPGADFAALAKEHSNGPTGSNGGDLGTFDKGRMHKNFAAAAWKLKVGDISDVVETPFGFHIIKRTK